MQTGIYGIYCKTTNKWYIGQSIDIKRRWRQELQGKCNHLLKEDLKKYGVDNFTFSILEECPQEELNNKEIYWINEKSAFLHGYNLTTGGSGTKNNGNIFTLDFILNVIQYIQNNPTLSDEDYAKKFGMSDRMIREIISGRSWHQDNITYPLRTLRKEKREKMPRTSAVNVPKEELARLLYEKKTWVAVGKIFNLSPNAVKKQAVKMGLPPHIKEVKNWYIINILHQEIPSPKIVIHKKHYKYYQYDFSGKLLYIFNSSEEVRKTLKIHSISHIHQVCRGERVSAYGYLWAYEEI